MACTQRVGNKLSMNGPALKDRAPAGLGQSRAVCGGAHKNGWVPLMFAHRRFPLSPLEP
jgi:hypothetical protein